MDTRITGVSPSLPSIPASAPRQGHGARGGFKALLDDTQSALGAATSSGIGAVAAPAAKVVAAAASGAASALGSIIDHLS
jgi:hypothetical protein